MKTLLLILLPFVGICQISKVDSVRQLVKHGVFYKYIAPVNYAEPKEVCRLRSITTLNNKHQQNIIYQFDCGHFTVSERNTLVMDFPLPFAPEIRDTHYIARNLPHFIIVK